MDFTLDYKLIGMVLIGVAFIIIFSNYRWKVVQWVGRGMVHVVIGALLLYFANVIGGLFDFTIPFNLVTLGVTAVLGIPGLISLAIIKLFII